MLRIDGGHPSNYRLAPTTQNLHCAGQILLLRQGGIQFVGMPELDRAWVAAVVGEAPLRGDAAMTEGEWIFGVTLPIAPGD